MKNAEKIKLEKSKTHKLGSKSLRTNHDMNDERMMLRETAKPWNSRNYLKKKEEEEKEQPSEYCPRIWRPTQLRDHRKPEIVIMFSFRRFQSFAI